MRKSILGKSSYRSIYFGFIPTILGDGSPQNEWWVEWFFRFLVVYVNIPYFILLPKIKFSFHPLALMDVWPDLRPHTWPVH